MDDKKEVGNKTKNEKDTEDFVMDKIVDDRTMRSRNHNYFEHGETSYRTRWSGFKPPEDPWKPIAHLPRTKVLSYARSNKVDKSTNIDNAQQSRIVDGTA